jgi:DUF177 domain-containing protein
MIIRVSELPDEGLTFVDVRQFVSPYSDTSWQLDDVSLRLDRDGTDVLVHGQLAATVPQTCGRCLESFPARVRAFVDLRLAPRPTTAMNVELAADDLDVDFYANDQLDLDALIETETTLALPMKPLCREDCRGLCPVCGGNRNHVTCSCDARPADARLAVLKDWAARQKS